MSITLQPSTHIASFVSETLARPTLRAIRYTDTEIKSIIRVMRCLRKNFSDSTNQKRCLTRTHSVSQSLSVVSLTLLKRLSQNAVNLLFNVIFFRTKTRTLELLIPIISQGCFAIQKILTCTRKQFYTSYRVGVPILWDAVVCRKLSTVTFVKFGAITTSLMLGFDLRDSVVFPNFIGPSSHYSAKVHLL